MRYIGTIDRSIYHFVTPDIQTDEIVITEKQIQHIRAHHPGSYELFADHLTEIVEAPDYILEANRPHSALILKEITSNGKRVKLVLRLHTSGDDPNYKNSVITFTKIDERDWNRLIRNKKVLYKRV